MFNNLVSHYVVSNSREGTCNFGRVDRWQDVKANSSQDLGRIAHVLDTSRVAFTSAWLKAINVGLNTMPERHQVHKTRRRLRERYV